MKPNNFFAELRRRKVFKVGAAYLVVAWLAVQAVSIGFPAFDAPPWALRVFILVALLGFPIAVVMAWVFDLTPAGVKLDPDTSGSKRLFAVAALLIVLALGWYFYGQPSFRKGDVTTPSTADKKSIAVLPFDNLSRDPDNAYFCEGVQDEILTRLAKVTDLKVISRTSTQHFKSTPDNLPQIAKQLGVAHILEGTVQKAGDQVRVNVQLINALTDAHLWADTYDRKLTDIFAVESEISKAIAETLQAKLTGSEKIQLAKKPTANPEAYELYLKGRFFWNKRSGADLRKSIEYLNQAIAKDPGYALAYAALADSCAILRFYGGAALDESIVPARAAATKALELDDSLAEAHASLGLIATEELDLERAVSELKRAVQLNPNYATGHHWLGLALTALAQFDQAIPEGKRALELDPLSMIINADLSVFYFYARRYDLAEAQARKAVEIGPQSFLAHYYLGMALQLTGRLKEAMPEFQKAVELNNDPFSLGMLIQAYARNGQLEEAQQTLARLNEVTPSGDRPAYALALAHTSLGEKEKAIEELEQAYNSGNRSYLFILKVDPFLDELRGEPRFEALVQKIVAPKTVNGKK
jgi:TolB-like protein/Flp pilus assembly protein TadD